MTKVALPVLSRAYPMVGGCSSETHSGGEFGADFCLVDADLYT